MKIVKSNCFYCILFILVAIPYTILCGIICSILLTKPGKIKILKKILCYIALYTGYFKNLSYEELENWGVYDYSRGKILFIGE